MLLFVVDDVIPSISATLGAGRAGTSVVGVVPNQESRKESIEGIVQYKRSQSDSSQVGTAKDDRYSRGIEGC